MRLATLGSISRRPGKHQITLWIYSIMDRQTVRRQSFAVARTSMGSRAGMSILEFVGCSLALVGGLWLGAIYLGVDVRQATYVALADSKLMDTVPESWRPEWEKVS